MTAADDLLRLGIEPVIPKRRGAALGESGYARRPRDAYFTPSWVTQCLVKAVELVPYPQRRNQVVWEPACGDGAIAEVLRHAGYEVCASDIADYGYNFGTAGVDFFAATTPGNDYQLGAIVTNPPFDLALPFIRRALELTAPRDGWLGGKVAILQRHEFDAPASHHPLFRHPFKAKLVLPRRPKWSDDDKASPRFPFAWFLWDWRHSGDPVLRFLPDPDKKAQEAML